LTKSSKSTFPWYAISASVGTDATPRKPGLYLGQLGAGEPLTGSLTKFANAVWKLFDSSTSAAVAVDLLNVPKRMGTIACKDVGVVEINRQKEARAPSRMIRQLGLTLRAMPSSEIGK
jgi:hypothetical protein